MELCFAPRKNVLITFFLNQIPDVGAKFSLYAYFKVSNFQNGGQLSAPFLFRILTVKLARLTNGDFCPKDK